MIKLIARVRPHSQNKDAATKAEAAEVIEEEKRSMAQEIEELKLFRFRYHPIDFYTMSEKNLEKTIRQVYGVLTQLGIKKNEELTNLKYNREVFRTGYVQLEQIYAEKYKNVTEEEYDDGAGEEFFKQVEKYCEKIAFLNYRSAESVYHHLIISVKLK